MNTLLTEHLEDRWRITYYYEKPFYYVKAEHKNIHGELLFSSIFKSEQGHQQAFLAAHEWIDKQETMHG